MAEAETRGRGDGRARLAPATARGGDDPLTRAWALVESHLAFAAWVARAYGELGVSEEDLEAEGYLGLLEAALRFDPDRGVKFSTYAAWWVRKRVQHSVAAQAGLVRLPDYQRRRLAAVRLAERDLTAASGRKPTAEEIAQRCGLEPADVERALSVWRREVSLEDLVSSDDDRRVEELLPERRAPSPDSDLLRDEMAGLVARLLDRLTARQRAVLCLRFGFEGNRPLALAEVARRIGISRERVRQVERKALQQLRELMKGAGSAGSR